MITYLLQYILSKDLVYVESSSEYLLGQTVRYMGEHYIVIDFKRSN